MAKQIKKVFFHQVSAFLGLAVIVSFSSILGAILLRQVLAAPAGQGSIKEDTDIILTRLVELGHHLNPPNNTDVFGFLKNILNSQSDIKGNSFVKDVHSLKQIRDKLDTVGGGGCYNIAKDTDVACGGSIPICPNGSPPITTFCTLQAYTPTFIPQYADWAVCCQ